MTVMVIRKELGFLVCDEKRFGIKIKYIVTDMCWV